MATNSVKVTLQIRHDSSSNWTTRNPVLAQGEYGLELDTFLIKIGDGLRDWAHLPYLNKLDSSYFKWEADGTLTFSDEFMNTISALEALAGDVITSLTITNPPVNDTDATNKKYVDDAIRNAGHLKREIVEVLPASTIADENTLYMIRNGNHYDEYMIINGVWDTVGTTGDSGQAYQLQIATEAILGGVRSSNAADSVSVNPQTGFMTLNYVSTSKLYVPTGDTFIIYGGSA